MTKLSVVQIAGPYCGTHAEGEKVYMAIEVMLRKHERIELDFDKIELASSSFFNELFGRIIDEFGEEFLASHLSYTSLKPRHTFVLERTRHINPV